MMNNRVVVIVFVAAVEGTIYYPSLFPVKDTKANESREDDKDNKNDSVVVVVAAAVGVTIYCHPLFPEEDAK